MDKERSRSRFEDQALINKRNLERRNRARSIEMQMVHDNPDGNLTRTQQAALSHEVSSGQKPQKKSIGVGNVRNATAAELRAHANKVKRNAT
ncbi:MAG: hypothetical protein Q8P07_00020 [bacterium]|nr:hypothetical protein [bacterium]